MQISKYLTLSDVEKSNTAIRKKISNALPAELVENAKYVAELYDIIYDHFKGNVYVNSFYRSPALNKAVGGSKTSLHMQGQAIDIEGKNGVTNLQVLEFCKTLDFDELINEYPKNGQPSWVHIGRRKGLPNRKRIKVIS